MPKPATNLKVFISYSRADAGFADQLRAALTACGFTVSIDREAPGGIEWWDNLRRQIRECDTVVFVLSPSSAQSTHCADEVKEAAVLKKRILTLTCTKLASGPPPPDGPLPMLSHIQSIFFYEEPKFPNSGFGEGLRRLVEALNLDFDWVLDHTRYLGRAMEWQEDGKPGHLLLKGPEIAAAQAWAARPPKKAPDPTPLHIEYIAASEAAENDQLATRMKELEDKERVQKERLVALRHARWMLVGLLVLAIATFGGAAWQTYETSRREAQIFESKAMEAFEGGAFDRAIRHGLAGLPAPGSPPLSYRSTVLEDILRLSHGSDRTIAILGGHGGAVSRISFAPTGKYVLTQSTAGSTVKLWDGETGLLKSARLPSRANTTFSKSGELFLATTYRGSKGHVWHASTGKPVIDLPGNVHGSFSQDGRRFLAKTDKANAPELWNIETETGVPVPVQPANGKITWVGFSPDSSRIVGEMGTALALWDAQDGRLIKELTGHTGKTDERFSDDGRLLASWAENDPQVRLWNATTGGIIAVLPGHKIVAEAEFSKPGSRLVTRDAANARLWDTATGNLVNELGGSVETLMFNSDGTRLLTVAKPESAQTKPTIQLWDTATGTLVKVLEGHLGEIDDPIFNKDGTRLVTTSKQNPTARLWNGLTGELCAELNGHDGPVSAVFDPTGTRLLTSAKNDTVAILWYADTGRQVSQLQGHSGAVKSSLFDSTGTLLATAGRDDRTIRVWDAHGGTLVASLDGHQRPIVGLAFSPDGHRLLSRADGEEAARMWDLKPRASAPSRPLPKVLGDGANTVPRGNAVVIFDRSGSPVADAPGAALLVRADDQIVLKVLGGHSDAVQDAWFFAGNKRLLTSEGNEGARLLLWDAESGTQLRVLKHASGEMAASQSAYFADGQRLATMASGDRSVQLWNSVTGEHVKELTGHGAAVSALVMSQTGGRLVSRAKGETFALLWDAATGEKIGTGLLDGHPGEVSRVAISDAGDRIATAGDGSSAIKLWNGLTGGLVGDLNGHAGPAIENMAFSKDSKLLLTQAKDDAVAWLWNAETGKPLFKLIGQEEFLTSATFSLDGLHAVTLSNTLSNEFKVRRVWSLATGQQVTKFQHDGGGQPTWLCSPSKPHEVAEWCTSRAAGDKVVLLWNNKTGQLIARLAGHIGAVSSAKFTKDGRRLVTWAAADNEARLWDSEHGGVLVRSLPHAAAVTSVLVTQDDALIVTRATGDPIARLWDAKTGNPVAELGFRNTSSLRTMMLVKNDNQLLTVSGDAVRLWDIRGFSMDRTKEAYDLVCDGQENASKRRFSPSEMADPILKGADTLQQPCDRVGPLRLKYWKTLLARSGHGVR